MEHDSSTPFLMTRRGFATGTLATTAMMLAGGTALAPFPALANRSPALLTATAPARLASSVEGVDLVDELPPIDLHVAHLVEVVLC